MGDGYYVMVNVDRTLEQAEQKFRAYFGRKPDTVLKDHNYWWLGEATEKEVAEAERKGLLKHASIIEGRYAP